MNKSRRPERVPFMRIGRFSLLSAYSQIIKSSMNAIRDMLKAIRLIPKNCRKASGSRPLTTNH